MKMKITDMLVGQVFTMDTEDGIRAFIKTDKKGEADWPIVVRLDTGQVAEIPTSFNGEPLMGQGTNGEVAAHFLSLPPNDEANILLVNSDAGHVEPYTPSLVANLEENIENFSGHEKEFNTGIAIWQKW
jgi:hypothetical protein